VHVTSLGLLSLSLLLWLGARGGSSGDYGIAYHIRVAQARAIVYGTGADGPDPSGLRCNTPTSEVRWLVIHAIGTRDVPGHVQLCEGWLDRDTHREYVWTIQR